MTVSIFGTEVDRRVLISVGVAIVGAALVYFWNNQSHDVPLWCIIATAVVVLVPAVAFGWHRWTRRRPTLGLGDGDGGSTLGLGDGDGGSTLGLGDGDGGSTLGLGDGDGGSTLGLGNGGSVAALRLSDRRNTRRDEDAESLFNLSESFMTVQSFPKVRRYK